MVLGARPSPRILEGIRVIELTVHMVGPRAGSVLGDLGADVVKVELPEGEPGRQMTRVYGLELRYANGAQGSEFDAVNRSKRSIVIDARRPEGLDLLRSLIRVSDVFIQNLRPGAADKLGLGYEALREENPRLVYATGSGFGARGPDASKGAIDTVGLARGGGFYLIDPDGEPLFPLGAFADAMASTMLSFAIVSALLARERFGIAQQVHVSQLGSLIWLQNAHVSMHMIGSRLYKAQRREAVDNPLMGWYRCADGKYICFGAPDSDKYWHDFCLVTGLDELEFDTRFQDHEARHTNAGPLIERLDAVFGTKPIAEWLQGFSRTPTQIPAAQIMRLDELVGDPQVLANGYIQDAPDGSRPEKHPSIGVDFGETPTVISRGPRKLGEDTAEVLREWLRIGDADLAELRSKAVTM